MLSLILVSMLTGATQPDAWLTVKTKLALFTAAGVSSTRVSVDVVDGTVTLYGKVGSSEERQRAEAEAAKVEGVKHIRDLLQVVADIDRSATNQSDQEIRDSVWHALKSDPSLDKSTIDVRSVDNGVVLIGGKAASLTDHLRAVEIASASPGVKRVQSEIESPNRLADEEIWRDRDGKAGPESFADGASDVWMTSQIKIRLLADSKVPALEVGVDTNRGIVTLFGMVNSKEAVTAALADAHKIKGVREVRDELQVVATARAEDVKARDKDLQKAIATAMKDHGDLGHVDITVKNGVARLTGSVPSAWDRIHAAEVTRSLRGVRAVEDDLQINKE